MLLGGVPVKILGISGAFGHDAAAALVVDGKVIAACEEERFTRSKRSWRQPALHSVDACLRIGDVSVSDLDCIAVGWDPSLAPQDHRLADNLKLFLSSYRLAGQKIPPVRFVPHHRAHAALAYFTSGFDEACILVADGQSEDASTTIYWAQGNAITEVRRFGIEDSLGFFYAALTRYAGFAPGGAGKVMGLSAFGNVTYDFPEITLERAGYTISMPGKTKDDRMIGWLNRFESVFGVARSTSGAGPGRQISYGSLGQHIHDAAASGQAALERAWLHITQLALALTQSKNLVVSGGVALNCSANGRVRDALPAANIFIHGAAHDGGTALGAALALASEDQAYTGSAPARDLFLGDRFDEHRTVDLARRLGLLVVDEPNALESAVARRIADDCIGGWFKGRAEYGPRALGGRSIIARADKQSVSNRVNRVKGREAWRPVSPAMSSIAAAELEIDGRGLDFMIEARWLREDLRGATGTMLAGVVHADRSIRPLVVTHQDHPFSGLLVAVGQEIGSEVVANTSFNTESEPIVNSPADALRTFAATDLDFLVLNDVLLCKP